MAAWTGLLPLACEAAKAANGDDKALLELPRPAATPAKIVAVLTGLFRRAAAGAMGDVRDGTEMEPTPRELSGALAAPPPPPPTQGEADGRDIALPGLGCKSVAAADADPEAVLAKCLDGAGVGAPGTLAMGDAERPTAVRRTAPKSRPCGTLQETAPPLAGFCSVVTGGSP